ncbi:homeobox protein 13-related [Anaeramoeba flamelloides]|uniref:Homeobox protein 13-related n=1 Tax=Anaeramoeba flamelloides TaxID=1746091 RepID=A0AAV7ZNF1_9EUKA|nr:homeobox protein 13-related [Anaeramoeba flamelloides]
MMSFSVHQQTPTQTNESKHLKQTELIEKLKKVRSIKSRLMFWLKLYPESISGLKMEHLIENYTNCNSKTFVAGNPLENKEKDTVSLPKKIKIQRKSLKKLSEYTGVARRSLERGLSSFFFRQFSLQNISPYSREWIIYGQNDKYTTNNLKNISQPNNGSNCKANAGDTASSDCPQLGRNNTGHKKRKTIKQIRFKKKHNNNKNNENNNKNNNNNNNNNINNINNNNSRVKKKSKDHPKNNQSGFNLDSTNTKQPKIHLSQPQYNFQDQVKTNQNLQSVLNENNVQIQKDQEELLFLEFQNRNRKHSFERKSSLQILCEVSQIYKKQKFHPSNLSFHKNLFSFFPQYQNTVQKQQQATQNLLFSNNSKSKLK